MLYRVSVGIIFPDFLLTTSMLIGWQVGSRGSRKSRKMALARRRRFHLPFVYLPAGALLALVVLLGLLFVVVAAAV